MLKDDQPARRIFVSAFYLDEHEVTNEQYLAFVKAARHAAPYNWPKGKLPAGKEKFPVVDVGWTDAAAYCRWAGKRLPTEAEWERAARGLVEGKKYPWGDDLPTKDNSRFDSLDGPGEVRQFKPNYFGVYDTAGNVWEWCSDWYAKDYYASAPPRDPMGPDHGLYRALRGGSWADEPKFLTCAHRSWARLPSAAPISVSGAPKAFLAQLRYPVARQYYNQGCTQNESSRRLPMQPAMPILQTIAQNEETRFECCWVLFQVNREGRQSPLFVLNLHSVASSGRVTSVLFTRP